MSVCETWGGGGEEDTIFSAAPKDCEADTPGENSLQGRSWEPGARPRLTQKRHPRQTSTTLPV